MSNYVYIPTDSGKLFTVGFYDPQGKWIAESDHENQEEAVTRVHYLNGGMRTSSPRDTALLVEISRRIADPGSYTRREDDYREPIFRWSARAVALMVSERFEAVNEVLRSNSVELEKLRRENQEARESLTVVRKQRDNLIQWGQQREERLGQICELTDSSDAVKGVESLREERDKYKAAASALCDVDFKAMHECASARLEYIEEVFAAHPDARIRYCDQSGLQDELGEIPRGWSLRIPGINPLVIAANRFLDVIGRGVEIARQSAEGMKAMIELQRKSAPKDTEYICRSCGNKFMDYAGITILICDDCIPF